MPNLLTVNDAFYLCNIIIIKMLNEMKFKTVVSLIYQCQLFFYMNLPSHNVDTTTITPGDFYDTLEHLILVHSKLVKWMNR